MQTSAFEALARRLQANRIGLSQAMWSLGASTPAMATTGPQDCAQSPVTGQVSPFTAGRLQAWGVLR